MSIRAPASKTEELSIACSQTPRGEAVALRRIGCATCHTARIGLKAVANLGAIPGMTPNWIASPTASQIATARRVTAMAWNVFSLQNAMVAPRVQVRTMVLAVIRATLADCSRETPPSNGGRNRIGATASNALNAPKSPEPTLPKTTSELLSEVIKSRVSVCLSFSWLTAVTPAKAPRNIKTNN